MGRAGVEVWRRGMPWLPRGGGDGDACVCASQVRLIHQRAQLQRTLAEVEAELAKLPPHRLGGADSMAGGAEGGGAESEPGQRISVMEMRAKFEVRALVRRRASWRPLHPVASCSRLLPLHSPLASAAASCLCTRSRTHRVSRCTLLQE